LKQSIWSILALLPLGALAAEVYVSVDANGQIVYSDRPSDSGEDEVLQVRGGGSTQAASPVAEEAAVPAADESVVVEVRRDPTPEERAANCEIARQRGEAYTAAYRMYRELPDGEREYLTADEIDEQRAAVAAEVDEWCS